MYLNNYKYTIGEELECKLEVENKYSSHAIVVLAKEKNKNRKEKREKNWIKSGLGLVIFQTL